MCVGSVQGKGTGGSRCWWPHTHAESSNRGEAGACVGSRWEGTRPAAASVSRLSPKGLSAPRKAHFVFASMPGCCSTPGTIYVARVRGDLAALHSARVWGNQVPVPKPELCQGQVIRTEGKGRRKSRLAHQGTPQLAEPPKPPQRAVPTVRGTIERAEWDWRHQFQKQQGHEPERKPRRSSCRRPNPTC